MRFQLRYKDSVSDFMDNIITSETSLNQDNIKDNKTGLLKQLNRTTKISAR